MVEQTLEGQQGALKERLLGIEVFHRNPDYDTNQDPVVRLSAAEVRKRIALYYQHPDHQNELVIGLNPGSYIPYFRPPQPAPDSPTPVRAETAADTGPIPAVASRRRWLLVPSILAACMDSDSMYIVDHKSPSARGWVVSLKQPPSSQNEDFAVIARYQDTTLDQPVVVAAGLSRQGTEAAGELLSNAAFLKTLFKNAPRDWTKVNLEAVVQTQVVDGHPGPLRILAVEYW